MAQYREKMQGTTSSGYRHPDPLEVTRTTSTNSMSSVPDSPVNSRLSAAAAVFECDYDTNPTVLYQAIEAKQWDYAISIFTNRGNNKNVDDEEEEEAAATWVVRKESNGKLRWRLLPLHAAVIFGSPLKLIELLLADYPLAAQCKDDRGMLPLHLAFRKEASWDVIDELLTVYPLAVFVSDRKGRTPLKCGVSISLPKQQSKNNNHNTIQQVSSTLSEKNDQSLDASSCRTAAGVIELYSQIVISGERKRVEQETRALAQTSITQIQDSHKRQVEVLRKKMKNDNAEKKQQIEELERENKEIEERLLRAEEELVERDQSHLDLTKKLQLTNVKLNLANERAEVSSNASSKTHEHQNNSTNRSIDKLLRMMAEKMLKQQKAYHRRVKELLINYQELLNEREAMRSIFLKESVVQQQKEASILESFRHWFREEDQKLSLQERSLLSPPPTVDCRTDFEKEKVEKNEIVLDCNDPSARNKVTEDITKVTTTTMPTVEEKNRPVSVPIISSPAIPTAAATYRVPLSDADKQERPLQKEPREAPA